jgi:FtsZ-binding cell division protein ZapB
MLEKDSEWQELEKFTSDMFTTIDADNENLRKENERLRSEVELLTTKIEELSGKVEN